MECNQSFNSEQSLKLHKKVVHQKIKDHKCKVCPKAFGNSHNLDRHIESVHGAKTIPCKLCGKTFKMESYLNIHMETVHEPKVVKCNQCDKEYSSQRYLNTHITRMHCENNKEEKCSICLKTVKKLFKHQIDAHSNEYHKCDHCDKQLRLSSMSAHIEFVHKKIQNFPCDICKKTFSKNAKLTRHKDSVHTGDKNHKCVICDKTFPLQENVKQHLKRVHEKYVCDN